MNGRGFWELQGMTDGDLERDLRLLLSASQRTEARIVAHLAEVDARRIHLKAGGSSLFAYCTKRLGLSEMEAFYRITAARLARKYPLIFGLLEQGQVHLSGIYAVRRCLTNENHADLLQQIAGKSRRQIEHVLARRFPRADIAERVQVLPSFDPLSPERYGLHLTISKELKEKLELARALFSHAHPSGDLAVIIERALDPFIKHLEARRFGRTQTTPRRRKGEARQGGLAAGVTADKPGAASSRASDREAPSRKRAHIANEARRAVVARDGACCSFVGDDGTCCGSRAFLQLHHETPWARGGSDEPANLRVLCAAHNQLLAELEYGEAHVAQASAGRVNSR